MPLTLGVSASGVHALVPSSLYLDVVAGYASTPDFASMVVSGDFNIAARAILPAATGANRFLVAQWPTGPSSDQSILWYITTTGIMQMTMRNYDITQPSAAILTAAEVNAFGGGPVYIGVRCRASTGRMAALTSADGITWTEVGTPVTTLTWTQNINSTVALHIGSRSVTGADKFNQRIYWVEMRAGLNPGAGTLRFRFDAAESTGTTWTDPRGLPWTLSAAGAIHA